MKTLINAVAGGEKNATPARKYTAYAVVITAIALLLAMLVLVVSSIAFAVSDSDVEDTAPAGSTGDGDALGSGSGSSMGVTYAAVSADTLTGMLDREDVVIQEKRSVKPDSTDKYYYAMAGDTLKSDTQKALDAMLVAYNKEKGTVVFVGGAKQSSNSSGLAVEIRKDASSFSEAEAITNDGTKGTYGWIYTNAYKYGFIYSGNTFTYVGVPIATYMNNNKSLTTFDALVSALKNKTSNVSVTATAIGASKATSYQLYYVSASGELKAPTNYGYSVVANGTDGYVIVIDMSNKISTTAG